MQCSIKTKERLLIKPNAPGFWSIRKLLTAVIVNDCHSVLSKHWFRWIIRFDCIPTSLCLCNDDANHLVVLMNARVKWTVLNSYPLCSIAGIQLLIKFKHFVYEIFLQPFRFWSKFGYAIRLIETWSTRFASNTLIDVIESYIFIINIEIVKWISFSLWIAIRYTMRNFYKIICFSVKYYVRRLFSNAVL